jgi:hypothetical protein
LPVRRGPSAGLPRRRRLIGSHRSGTAGAVAASSSQAMPRDGPMSGPVRRQLAGFTPPARRSSRWQLFRFSAGVAGVLRTTRHAACRTIHPSKPCHPQVVKERPRRSEGEVISARTPPVPRRLSPLPFLRPAPAASRGRRTPGGRGRR